MRGLRKGQVLGLGERLSGRVSQISADKLPHGSRLKGYLPQQLLQKTNLGFT